MNLRFLQTALLTTWPLYTAAEEKESGADSASSGELGRKQRYLTNPGFWFILGRNLTRFWDTSGVDQAVQKGLFKQAGRGWRRGGACGHAHQAAGGASWGMGRP